MGQDYRYYGYHNEDDFDDGGEGDDEDDGEDDMDQQGGWTVGCVHACTLDPCSPIYTHPLYTPTKHTH